MADRPPWLDYQQGVTVPLGPADPYKRAAEARAERADTRAAATASREQAKFEQEQGGLTPPGDLTKTGEEYLRTLPPGMAAQVQAIADGRRAIPSSTRNKEMMTLLAAASQYDPTLDAANAATRVATRKKFTSGTTRDNITAINTALGHLGTLWKDAQGLDNRGIPLWNSIANKAESAVGDPRVSKFNLTKHAVVDELEKAFRGSGGTQTGIEEWSQAINSSQSPEQLRAAVGKAVELLSSRLDALSDAYSTGMGKSADPMTFLNPHAQKVFSALGPGGDGNVPDPPKGGGGTPPVLGPDLTPATGVTKTEMLPATPEGRKIAAMLGSGVPAANIRAYANANNFTGNLDSLLAWRAMHPTYKGGYDVHQEQIVPTTAFNRWASDPNRAALLAAADAGTAGLTDEATGAVNALRTGQPVGEAIDSADYQKQLLLGANPKSALAGSVLGGVGAMMGGGAALKGLGLEGGWLAANPIKAAALGDTAYGTAFGAGENNDDRALGAGVGLVASPLASLGGAGATRVLGAGLRGVTNPAVERLKAAGIPLTVGEVLGGGWKKAQDAMTNVLGPGGRVSARYNEGRRALNEAAFNQAGAEVNTPINAVGQQGIEALDAAKSQAYSNALDPVSLDLNDPTFIATMRAALNKGGAIPPGELPEGFASNTLKHYVGNQAPDGTMTGPAFQRAYRGIAQSASKATPKVEGHQVGEVLGQGKDALATALEDQNPGAYADFLRANSANRHLSVLRNALDAAQNQVNDAGEQLFTPAQLGRAATNNAKAYGGKAAAASGNRPFNQLALDAQQVMSSKIPDSGTQARLVAAGLATGGALGGGGVGYGAGGGEGAVEGAAIPLGALTLLGTKKGQQLLTAALLKRVAPFRVAGTALRRNPQIGGDILTAAGIPLLTAPGR